MDVAPADLAELRARIAIEDTLITLFVATDKRDWSAVRAVFTPHVMFDMTSLAGGEPQTLAPETIAAGWEEGLRPIEVVHHQVGNLQIRVNGERAHATCYGVAYHFRHHPSGRNTRIIVGSYDVDLQREQERWRISLFRFNCKFVDGNSSLERDD